MSCAACVNHQRRICRFSVCLIRPRRSRDWLWCIGSRCGLPALLDANAVVLGAMLETALVSFLALAKFVPELARGGTSGSTAATSVPRIMLEVALVTFTTLARLTPELTRGLGAVTGSSTFTLALTTTASIG